MSSHPSAKTIHTLSKNCDFSELKICRIINTNFICIVELVYNTSSKLFAIVYVDLNVLINVSREHNIADTKLQLPNELGQYAKKLL